MTDNNPIAPTIKRLRELTASLTSEMRSRELHMSTSSGKMVKYGLMKTSDVAIAHFNAEAGTVVLDHTHCNEKELMGVVDGSMVVTMPDGRKLTVDKYDVIEIKQGVAHRLEFPVATKGWAITMPADEGFPDGYTTDTA